MAVFTLVFSIGYVIGPGIGTLVYEHLGSDVLWFGCGLLGIVLWPLFVIMARK